MVCHNVWFHRTTLSWINWQDENQDGHDGSYVECYLKEHRGSSVENARQIVAHMISDMWKRLNKECLSPNPFSTSFTKGSLNIARMVPLMYSYDDQQCLPGLEEHMKSLLLENLPYRNTQKINEWNFCLSLLEIRFDVVKFTLFLQEQHPLLHPIGDTHGLSAILLNKFTCKSFPFPLPKQVL